MSGPFSDSASGEMFIANRCHRCVHRGEFEGSAEPCDEFTTTYLGEWPEILYRSPESPVGVECRKFDDGRTTVDRPAQPSPTQLALRELMLLTKCYCDGAHPRLGHNCSFRPDVATLVTAIGKVLERCDDGYGDGVWTGYVDAEEVRAALLGVEPRDQWPPERKPELAEVSVAVPVADEEAAIIDKTMCQHGNPGYCDQCNQLSTTHSALIAAKLQVAAYVRPVGSDVEGEPVSPG